MIGQILITLVVVVLFLIAVAYYTLAERKIMASVQRRLGPNVVGPWGLLQPLADGLKLIIKEIVIPTRANARLFLRGGGSYLVACIFLGVPCLLSWYSLDKLFMLIVVTLISFCVHVYSSEYMGSDPHLCRFMSFRYFSRKLYPTRYSFIGTVFSS